MSSTGGSGRAAAAAKGQPAWLLLAVASGTCAAVNGVFAKLTTTALTASWSASLAAFFSLAPDNTFINLALRSFFFGLNIVFNILMWSLFTAALTRASSTTRVSIINVSANFMITAFLGAAIFGEKLSGRWWLGAAFLAMGTVVIGRREEEADGKGEREGGVRLPDSGVTGEGRDGSENSRPGGEYDDEDEDDEQAGLLREERERAGNEAADIIDLGDEDLVGRVSADADGHHSSSSSVRRNSKNPRASK